MILSIFERGGCNNLEELDVSLNELTPESIENLCIYLPNTKLKSLLMSKNFLGDKPLVTLS